MTPTVAPLVTKTEIESPQTSEIDKLGYLIEMMPEEVGTIIWQHRDEIEEITLDIDRHPTVTLSGRRWRVIESVIFTDAMFARVDAKLQNGLNPIDKRGTLKGALHRFSGITDRDGTFTGMTIRLARAVYGASQNINAAFLKSFDPSTLKLIHHPPMMAQGAVDQPVSVLIIGEPGTGKTTELRSIIHFLQILFGPHVVVVDTSGDVSGGSTSPHDIMGCARIMPVPDPSQQHLIIGEAIANHSPWVLALDEMKYENDALRVEEAAQKCPVVSTVHGRNLRSVLQNKLLCPVVGNVDYSRMVRTTQTVFDVGIVTGRGYYVVYPNFQQSIDRLLCGEPDDGLVVARGAPEQAALHSRISNGF